VPNKQKFFVSFFQKRNTSFLALKGNHTMLRSFLVTALVLCGVAAHAAGVVDQLAGGWRLESRVTTLENGTVIADPALSAAPSGVLFYDRSGHMAAQLSRPGRTVGMLGDECVAAQKIKGTNDTAQTILGYDAYFGTFTVDEKAGVVTHHLASAVFPGDIGKDIKRWYKLSGDHLRLTFKTTLRDGTKVSRTLVWARMH
jgi:hypothetical protein